LRRSRIEGLPIHRMIDNAKVSSFADDTTLYVKETDDYQIIDECLDLFCAASTAKFNHEKTEIIPVGTKTFRESVVQTRTLCGKRLSDEIKIATDGTAVRILGAWQGNGVDASEKWDEILEKQLKVMKLWANSYPSALARARIAKALVVSRAFFLMTVNGISKKHLEMMEKNIRNFIWQGKKGPI
ncbi:hypothetical protein M408DRAFT_54534, partial [Serendipita vermifera MAFF 305830]